MDKWRIFESFRCILQKRERIQLKKRSMPVFFSLVLLQSMAANFAHPITPTIIKNLRLPDSMFGTAFAAMAVMNFVFSPFWGKLKEYVSARFLLLLGCAGYGVGQLFFCFSQTQATILAARGFSGIFVGCISVAMLVHILDASPKEKTGENLAKLAILQSLGAAFGYLTGGVVGEFSLTGTFLLQAVTLTTAGILFYFTLKGESQTAHVPLKIGSVLRNANPLRAFLDCRVFMTKGYLVLFIVTLLAYLGSNAFDQSFNYYIKDQFFFTSAYNGIIKAVIGIITLVSNSTVCMWLIRHADIKKATILSLLSCTISILLLLPMGGLIPFIATCILFFGCNSIFIPLLQDSVAKESQAHRSLVMGFYNAIISLGMIGGALIAGGVYTFNPKLPFAFAGLCFAFAAAFMIISYRQTKLYRQK